MALRRYRLSGAASSSLDAGAWSLTDEANDRTWPFSVGREQPFEIH